MTGEKIIEAVKIYREFYCKIDVHVCEFSKTSYSPSVMEMLAHCHWMLDEIEKFVQEGRIEKAFRWLGFIQGVLWSRGFFSIENLAKTNKGS